MCDTETSLQQDNLETSKKKTLVKNEMENKTDEIYDLHSYVQSFGYSGWK